SRKSISKHFRCAILRKSIPVGPGKTCWPVVLIVEPGCLILVLRNFSCEYNKFILQEYSSLRTLHPSALTFRHKLQSLMIVTCNGTRPHIDYIESATTR